MLGMPQTRIWKWAVRIASVRESMMAMMNGGPAGGTAIAPIESVEE